MNLIITEFIYSRFFVTALVLLAVFILYFFSGKNSRTDHFFIYFSILLSAVYLVWRLFFTLPLGSGTAAIAAGFLLFGAECMGFVQSLVFKILMTRPYENLKMPSDGFKVKPSVDILIATYNEDMRILRKTITACLNIQYPSDKLRVYLCDDGRRSEAKKLCEELGVQYITRKNNAHAKAGNINNALQYTDGIFFVLLDADMVPKPSFLNKTLGYFADESLGFVQTPQVFYNADPFQHNLRMYKKIPDEQDLFMQDIEKGRSFYNAVLHVGTNAVFRRSAVDAIGGIPVGTITEDMATGMLIQAKGCKTLFVPDILCTGLSVETFADLITQRERWCRGNIQVAKKWNPLTLPGLSLMQRIIYTDGLVYWFSGVQKMIFILCPVLYLLCGTAALQTGLEDLLLFWLPQFVAAVFSFEILVPKRRSLFWSHIYEIALAPYLAVSALMEAIFSRPLPFKVTPKGQNTVKTRFAFRIAIPHIVLFIFCAAALVSGVWQLIVLQTATFDSFLINALWTVYNAIGIFLSILVCIERPRPRNAERVRSLEKIKVHRKGNACRIVDVSETGAKIECSVSENSEEIQDELVIDSKSLGHTAVKVIWSKKEGKKKEMGIKFDPAAASAYKKIIKHISDNDKGYQDN